jgi:hypothetical protein
MPDQVVDDPTVGEPMPTPETTAFLLGTFADLYRQEIAAEEDVHRTLPFFGTALGIVIGSLAYAAGRLPRWTDMVTEHGRIAFCAATVLLALAIIEAGCVLYWVSRALARHDYKRITPESVFQRRLKEVQSRVRGSLGAEAGLDSATLLDMRQVLFESYLATTPVNRILNQKRIGFRSVSSSHLIRSLIWAVGATSVIFIADKFGHLPKVPL